jgi:hypothetical protein
MELVTWPTMPSLGALALGADMLMVWWVGGVGWFECVFELLDESVCVEGGREQEGEEVNKGPCEGGRQ